MRRVSYKKYNPPGFFENISKEWLLFTKYQCLQKGSVPFHCLQGNRLMEQQAFLQTMPPRLWQINMIGLFMAFVHKSARPRGLLSLQRPGVEFNLCGPAFVPDPIQEIQCKFLDASNASAERPTGIIAKGHDSCLGHETW